jgi:hypothetical protein
VAVSGPVVCASAAEAVRLVAGGGHVVLIVADAGAPLPPELHVGPGRVAIFVGDPTDPAVRAAAEDMGQELFSGSQ